MLDVGFRALVFGPCIHVPRLGRLTLDADPGLWRLAFGVNVRDDGAAIFFMSQ